MLITKSILLFLYNPVFTQVWIFWISCLYIIKIENVKRIKIFTKLGFLSPHSNTLVDRFQIWCLYFLFEQQRKTNFRTMPRGLSIHAVYTYTNAIR